MMRSRKMGTIGREVGGNKDRAVGVVTRRLGVGWVALLPVWFLGVWLLANGEIGGPVTGLSAYVAVIAFGRISIDVSGFVALINLCVVRGKLSSTFGRGLEQCR
jgi:hypothetical protein